MPAPKGRKPTSSAFKPGISGNPKGRPIGSGVVAQLRKYSSIEIIETMNKLLSMKRTDVNALREDPETSALELMVASIIVKGISAGDYRLNIILDRLMGRPTENHIITADVATTTSINDEERKRIAHEVEQILGKPKALPKSNP